MNLGLSKPGTSQTGKRKTEEGLSLVGFNNVEDIHEGGPLS